MSIVSGGVTVFSATHIPYQRNIIVHDIRSVVEYYMRQGCHALRSFTLNAKHNGTTQTLATFRRSIWSSTSQVTPRSSCATIS